MKNPTIDSRNPSRRQIAAGLAMALPVAAIAPAAVSEASTDPDAEILALADRLIEAEGVYLSLQPALRSARAALEARVEKWRSEHSAQSLEYAWNANKGTPEGEAWDAAHEPWDNASSEAFAVRDAMLKMEPTTARGLAAYMLASFFDRYHISGEFDWPQAHMLLLAAKVGGFKIPADLERSALYELDRVAKLEDGEEEGGAA